MEVERSTDGAAGLGRGDGGDDDGLNGYDGDERGSGGDGDGGFGGNCDDDGETEAAEAAEQEAGREA